MKLTPKKILFPVILGLIIWIIAFFIIGWTQISEDPAIQALYIPMVILFGIGTILLVVIFLWWYLPYLGINLEQEWLQESLLFGIILMAIQFILDIIIFTLLFSNSPLLIPLAIAGGRFAGHAIISIAFKRESP